MLEEISQYEKEQRERLENRMIFNIQNVISFFLIIQRIKLEKEMIIFIVHGA